MKKQVLSIEQMKHLHELGLDTSQAGMEYIEDNNGKILCIFKENERNIKDIEEGFVICEALTLQDIVDLLPKDILKGNGTLNYASLYIDYESNRIAYGNTDRDGFEIYYEVPIYENIIDAAYDMLCWCIENGYIITNKFNHESNNNL